MNISRQEFLNIILVARHIAKSDGMMEPVEIDALKKIVKSLQIKEAELEQMKQDTSLSNALNKLTSDDCKHLLIDILMFIACVDSELCDTEKETIKKIMRHLSINPETHPYFAEEVDASFIKGKMNALITRIQKSIV